MATPFDSAILTRRTDADLSSEPWTLVKCAGDNDMDQANSGELAFGVLTADVADGSTTAVNLPVQIGPLVRVKCGGAITAGTMAMSDNEGDAVAATSGNWSFGQALETMADGDIGLFRWATNYFETDT